ncbi:MAG: hypothetical protein ACKN9T_00345 [Candidatus Methylumidiphilus sp.]
MQDRTFRLSPLANANFLFWPEAAAVCLADLAEPVAPALLRLVGGNHALLRLAVQIYQTQGQCDEAARLARLGHGSSHARFTAYRENGDAERLRQYLAQQDLGRYDFWPSDALLSRLYWDSLLAERAGRFVWRCEIIRRIGREVLDV